MRGEKIATARLASFSRSADHGATSADDIDVERVQTLSSVVENRTFLSARKRRYKLFLNVLQKVNMCFLVLFVGYFVWTISANHAYKSSGPPGLDWNHSSPTNTSTQVNEAPNCSLLCGQLRN